MPSTTLDLTAPRWPDADGDRTEPAPRVSSLDSSLSPYRAGEVIANKYRVEQVLGCGAMAWVLSATHVQRNVTVALQFFRFEATRETIARFFPKGHRAARVSSEVVACALEVDRLVDGTPFLVMEHLEGFELQKLMDEPGWLPATAAVDFGIRACEGLAVIHGAKIADREEHAREPVSAKGSDPRGTKRFDFGVAKLAPARSFFASFASEEPVIGAHGVPRSPVYTAPEQTHSATRSTKNSDPRADIWSLGVLLCELLGNGASPFEAPTVAAACTRIPLDAPDDLSTGGPDLPLGLETVVYRCLERDPSRRYPDGQSLAIALAPYASRSGQLRARHLQHSRTHIADDSPFSASGSLPPMQPPPRPPTLPPYSRGPTGTLRLPAVAPSAQAMGQSPRNVLVACLAVALSLLGLLGTAILAVRAATPASSTQATTLAPGVPNRMPEDVPGPPSSLLPLPVDTGHVYAPEHLPTGDQGSVVAPEEPPRETSPAQALKRQRPAKSPDRVGPHGF
jgi:eukaryotic-like serine/threonine-protein kinase